MSKFHTYILKSFVKYLLLVDIFVSLMSLITSVLGESKDLARYSYSFLQFAELQMYSVALSHNLAMPISSSLATIIVIILLMRSNEMLAYVTLGGKLRSLIIPFIFAGVCVASFMIWWEYKIMPEVRINREALRAEIQGIKFVPYSKYSNLWLIDNSTSIVNIKVVDMLNEEVIGITEYMLDDNETVSEIVFIDSAKKQGDTWLLNSERISQVDTNPPIVTIEDNKTRYSELWDDLVRVAVTDVRALSPSQLATISDVMESRGMNVSRYDMLYYQKFSNAISVVVLLLCTFPIAVNFSRNYSIVKNASLMLVLGVVYWMIQSVTLSLGQTGTMTPFFANFTPIFLFAILSIIIMYRREKIT